MEQELTNKISKAVDIIKNGKVILMLTGAGISTESGLPDYRGDSGSRTNPDKAQKIMEPIKQKLAEIKYPENLKDHPYAKLLFGHDFLLMVEPNQTHKAITQLEKMNKITLLVSQNIDNLHLRSGFPPNKLVEIHGNCFKLRCKKCDITYDALELRKRVLKDLSYIPKCNKCGGELSSSVINFGDTVSKEDLFRAKIISTRCDVFIGVGSTIAVSPISYLFDYAKENNAKTIIINLGKTKKDRHADLIINEKSGLVLDGIVKGLKNTE